MGVLLFSCLYLLFTRQGSRIATPYTFFSLHLYFSGDEPVTNQSRIFESRVGDVDGEGRSEEIVQETEYRFT